MTNKYYIVPPEFLKGVFIIPHNFIDPENKAHATYVHNQSRYDLFYNAYEKIANIEARFLKQDNDYFRLKKIKSECSQDSFFEKFFTNYYINQNVSEIK